MSVMFIQTQTFSENVISRLVLHNQLFVPSNYNNQCLTSYSVVVKEPFSHTVCGVCSKPYNDPRILPCLHSFCQQCLHHEIEKSGSQKVFKCPTCERNMSIPVGEASGLPQNLHLGFEVEVAGYMSKIVQ